MPAPTPVLYGRTEPRIFTPPLRPLRDHVYDADGLTVLTWGTTRGYECIRFANDVLRIGLYPWQEWLLIHGLEINDDLTFRFRNLVVLVARQNGKSLLSQVLALFCMYILGVRLVLGTAQDLDTAEETWDGARELIDGTPELAELTDKPVMTNGKKTIRLKNDRDLGVRGERYKVKAAGRRSGRGLSGDLILLDELREHQTWAAWAAITKTTMARPRAQVWAFSNAGDLSSVVLRYLRMTAHDTLGDPDGINAGADPSRLLPDESEDLDLDGNTVEEDGIAVEMALEDLRVTADHTLGIFEWSAPPGCGVRDRDGWSQSNPALNYGDDEIGITTVALASAAGTDPEWTFRTECLCQWSDGTLNGPFPAGGWESGVDADSRIAEGASRGYCVDVAWDRTFTSIGASGLTGADLPHVEVIARRAGTDWVVGWFTDPAEPQRADYRVAIQPTAPAGSLIQPLRDAGIEVIEWSGNDLSKGCGAIFDRVKEHRLRHRPQPALDVAAGVAVPKSLGGDAWVWDRRRSPLDIAPLVACTGAMWLADTMPATADPFFAFA